MFRAMRYWKRLLAVGFSALGLATALFAIFVLYGSKIVAAFLLGKIILEPFTSEPVAYRMLPLLIGVIVFVLMHSLPIIGWVIGIAATALGLGAVVVMYVDQRRTARLEAV